MKTTPSNKEKFQALINGVKIQKFFIIPTVNVSYPRQALFSQLQKYANSLRAYETVTDRSVIGTQVYILPNGDRLTVEKIG